MEVNPQGFVSTEKRAVANSVNNARSLAHGNAEKDVAFLGFRSLGVFSSKPELTEFPSSSFRDRMPTSGVGVLLSHMLLGSHPLKVVRSVVGFVARMISAGFLALRSFFVRSKSSLMCSFAGPAESSGEIVPPRT